MGITEINGITYFSMNTNFGGPEKTLTSDLRAKRLPSELSDLPHPNVATVSCLDLQMVARWILHRH